MGYANYTKSAPNLIGSAFKWCLELEDAVPS